MASKDLFAAEDLLKTRLANKVGLEAEKQGLDVDSLASLCGCEVELAQKLLDNDTRGLSLMFVIEALTSVGLNVQFSTASSTSGAGQILFDLEDD